MKRCSLLLACLGLFVTIERGAAEECPDKIARLQQQVDRLTERVRQLGYPELRKRDPAELRVLKRQELTAAVLYEEIHRLFYAGAREGSAENWAHAGRVLALAKADLAWARQDVRSAVRWTALVVGFARFEVESVGKALEAGTVTLRRAFSAHVGHTHAQLALLRARKVAAHSKIDVTDISVPDVGQRLEDELRKKQQKDGQ